MVFQFILEQAIIRWHAEETNAERLNVRSRFLVGLQAVLFVGAITALMAGIGELPRDQDGTIDPTWWIPFGIWLSGLAMIGASLVCVLRPRIKDPRKNLSLAMASYHLRWTKERVTPQAAVAGLHGEDEVRAASWMQLERASNELYLLNARKQGDIAMAQTILSIGIGLLVVAALAYTVVGLG